jgi:hypothetical protein
VFWPGWLSEAITVGDDQGVGVVGTQDQGNPLVKRGRMSTHSLIRRTYIPWCVHDQPGNIYCTLYDHNYCDMELVGYAHSRDQFRFARRSIVEHRHPNWRKAQRDATYATGMAHFEDDKRLYQERSMHWWAPATHREAQRLRLRR